MTTTPSVIALVHELEQQTGVKATGRYRVAAYEMPLTHRCGARRVDELLEDFDKSTELLPSAGSANRATLGLDGNVYQWLGPCAYPETNLILIWEAAQDATVPGVTSPWDTGGLLTKGTLGRTLSDVEAMALLDAYSLELPAGRAYLGAVLECSFAEAGDYLDARVPQRWYPGYTPGAVPRDVLPPAHTFEVRRPCRVPVLEHLVAVVIDEPAFVDFPRRLRQLRRAVAAVGGKYVPCRERERCDAAARRILWQHLRDRGAL
jgi:hypothetical protein